MATKRTRAQLEAELHEQQKSDRIWITLSTLKTLIVVGGVVLVAYIAGDTIKVLAGRTTMADIGVRFLTNVKVSEAIAWLVGGGGVSYGYAQRGLRIRTAKRQGQHIERLEKLLDPDRTSSDYGGG